MPLLNRVNSKESIVRYIYPCNTRTGKGWWPFACDRLKLILVQTPCCTSQVGAIHAGLECGIIGAKFTGMDSVSFGPTIRGAHRWVGVSVLHVEFMHVLFLYVYLHMRCLCLRNYICACVCACARAYMCVCVCCAYACAFWTQGK
jgi:hypothetical protein